MTIRELRKYINPILVQPSDLGYDAIGITIKGAHVQSDHPRLDFARALSIFEKTDIMYKHGSSFIHERTVYDERKVLIGNHCTIGGYGFGYEYTEDGEIFQMPHLGNVVIEDGAFLHNSVCIDRAVIGSTVIGSGTKIDNLVHVAHGVKIGKNCLIVSGVVFGGSCEIGDYCFIGMNASIKQKVKIGKNCVIGAGAVVTKDIPESQIWVGNPARYLKDTEPRKYCMS